MISSRLPASSERSNISKHRVGNICGKTNIKATRRRAIILLDEYQIFLRFFDV